MKEKVVNLHDFIRGIKREEKLAEEEEQKKIDKVVVTYMDGTTEEIEKGALITLKDVDGKAGMGMAMLDMDDDDINDMVHGFSQFAIEFMMFMSINDMKND